MCTLDAQNYSDSVSTADSKRLRCTATNGLTTHVHVLSHRWPRMPKLISDVTCTQPSLVQDRRRRLTEHMRGHPRTSRSTFSTFDGSRRPAAGDYAPESTLPKRKELAAEYGVAPETVARATKQLEAEGLITSVRRRGTVVRSRPPMRRLGAERYAKSRWKFGDVVAFAADREASGRAWKPEYQTNTVAKIDADAEVAEALGVDAGSPAYERARLVKDGKTPTHTLTSYYRPADVEGTPLVDKTVGPAGRAGGFAVLTMQGLEPDHITESVYGRMPSPDEAAQLELPAGEPVMILKRWVFTADERVVEFARGVHAASRFQWSYSFPIPD